MNRYLKLLFVMAALLVVQGCATTLTKGADRRTDGIYIEDSGIESTAKERIDKKFNDKVHVNVNSYNRKVLITGEVPDEATKTEIFRIVGGVQNVSDIYNEVVIGFHSSLSDRSADVLTSGTVNFRLENTKKDFFRPDRVKVVVERGVVYLMGLVTHEEANVATEFASTSRGVKKVVPYFQFID